MVSHSKYTGLKPFKPGQSGNPAGSSRKKQAEIQFRKITYSDFLAKLQHYGSSPQKELDKVIEDPNTPAFDLMFVRIFNDAINGRSDARNIILDRLWGKAKNYVELSSANDPEADKERAELQKLSFEDLALLLKRMIPDDRIEG